MPMLGVWYVSLLAILFILVCLFMMLVILIQKPRGGGLSGAFGGAGGSAQAVFGAKTGDVLTWFTVFCFVAFLLLAVGLTWAMKPAPIGTTPAIEPPPASATATDEPEASTPDTALSESDSLLPQGDPLDGNLDETSPDLPPPVQP